MPTALALLIGACIPITLASIPAMSWLILALLAACLLALTRNKAAQFAAIILFSFVYACWHIDAQLQSILPAQYEKQIVTIEGYISSIVKDKIELGKYTAQLQHKASFEFTIIATDIPWKNPRKIKLSWINPSHVLTPGDKWNLKVKLMRPRNYYNPGSFDFELYCLYNHVSATGYVMPTQTQSYLGSTAVAAKVAKFRQHYLNRIKQFADLQYIGIISALTLGDKSSIPAAQNIILQQTGVAHLMSISGMHVAMVAGFAFFSCGLMLRRFAKTAARLNAKYYAALIALCVACCYTILSGAALATQRSIIMLSCALLTVLLRRRISAWARFSVALLLLILLDPLVVFAPGFWLSFLAVATLLYAYTNRKAVQPWWQRLIWPQLLIAITLLPLSLGVFAESSTVGLLANIIAIPAVTLLILPLSLAGMVLLSCNVNLASYMFSMADNVLDILLQILQHCNVLSPLIFIEAARFNSLILIVATLSCLWLFALRGVPGRYWAVLAFVPILFPRTSNIPLGTAEFTLLDVGQGLAAVVRTTNHVLVYDTGAKISADFDLGAKVVVPFLKRNGITHIDALMISHSDNDHIGGAQSLLDKITTEVVLLNEAAKIQHNNIVPCVGPQQWQWDNVTFTILHPTPEKRYRNRNNQSCVLQVQAGTDRILLTGDIETAVEKDLLAIYGDQLQSIAMLVPHHGSKTSSSWQFIKTVQPKYALVGAGYKNQYGHPKAPVVQSYQELGVKLFNTAETGAISLRLGTAKEPAPVLFVEQSQRVWQK